MVKKVLVNIIGNQPDGIVEVTTKKTLKGKAASNTKKIVDNIV